MTRRSHERQQKDLRIAGLRAVFEPGTFCIWSNRLTLGSQWRH